MANKSFQHTAPPSNGTVPASSSRSPTTIRLHEATFGEEEIAAAIDVLRSTQVTAGEKVKEFEHAFSAFFENSAQPIVMAAVDSLDLEAVNMAPGAITYRDVETMIIPSSPLSSAIMVNSGSSANLLAISALTNPRCGQLRPGDEVIVSALSWSTTVWPLVQHGLVPVIVDIDPETLNIDAKKARKAVSEKTRAIMSVHVYGNPCDMQAIVRLCLDKDLLLIEDCCEAMGATYQGEPVGTFGIIGTFSFYFSHHMTTLEGGACVTRHAGLDELMRILRAHGWTRDIDDRKYRLAYPLIDPKFLFVNAGYNLRATELQAAIGLVQLTRLSGFIDARRRAAEGLKNAFAPYQDLDVQMEREGCQSSWFGFPVVVNRKARFNSPDIRQHLEENGIETRSIICGNIADQPGMKLWEHRVHDAPLFNAEWVMSNGFSIGCHQGVGEEQIEHVSRVLEAFYG